MLPIFYSTHSLQPPGRLLSQVFTHLLCLLFCVWYKTKCEPGQPADDVDCPSFLFFLLFVVTIQKWWFHKQAGVRPRVLDQSCAFWRILLLNKSSWNCSDVSGPRSVCLPMFLNLFRPDNHLVCGQPRRASSKQSLDVGAEPHMSSLPIVCHTQAGSIWRHLGKQEAGDQSSILPIRLHFDVRAFRERPYPLSTLQPDRPEVLWYSGPHKNRSAVSQQALGTRVSIAG